MRIKGEVKSQVPIVLKVIGQRQRSGSGKPAQGIAIAVCQTQLRGFKGSLLQIVVDEQQDRLAALAAVKLLDGLVVALRLAPPDAVHHHGGVGITGHHAEQASFVVHHPLLWDIPDERILGAQHWCLIIHPIPQRNRQITQLAVDIADVGHREALVLVTLFQFLPQQIQRIVVGTRLAAYIAAVRAACSVGGRSVTNIDGSHAGYLHLTPCQ